MASATQTLPTISDYHPWRHNINHVQPVVNVLATFASRRRAEKAFAGLAAQVTSPALMVGSCCGTKPFPNMAPGLFLEVRLIYQPTPHLEYIIYTAEYPR